MKTIGKNVYVTFCVRYKGTVLKFNMFASNVVRLKCSFYFMSKLYIRLFQSFGYFKHIDFDEVGYIVD